MSDNLVHRFEYDPNHNSIISSVKKEKAEPKFSYILAINGEDYWLSPRGLAVQKYERTGSTELIRVLAAAKWEEIVYNDGMLEEIYG